MDKYITDERTDWKYELVGDYYLPIAQDLKLPTRMLPKTASAQ